jgi:excisionase family DNA binding protein
MAEGLPEGAVFSRPLTVRIPEACRLTGIGRSKLYELIAAGEIEVVKVGAITLVPVSSLTSFLRRKGGNL